MKNNSNAVEFYSKAMSSMPFIFSSHKFLGKLRKTGIRKEEIKSDFHLSFLLNNSERINKFLWRKKEVQIEIPLKVEDITKPDHINVSQIVKPTPARTELSHQDMINILKAEGYKVLKSTWNEL
jgi:hypothetical protein